jgi:hypothetical protein
MGMIRLLKPVLFFYECVRVLIMAVYMVFQSFEANIPIIAYTVPVVLFPLMALFIWLDVSRYKAYLPLFAAGKCIGILSLLIWSIYFMDITIPGKYGIGIINTFLLSGDFFAMAAILLIIKSEKKLTEKPALEVE